MSARHLVVLGALMALVICPAPTESRPRSCEDAPLLSLPPSQYHWQLITFGSDRVRVRLRGSDEWIGIRHPIWNPEVISSPLPLEEWEAGRLVRSDSLAVAWAGIEMIERRSGSYGWEGVGIGLAAGVLIGLIAGSEDDTNRGVALALSIPIGMTAGGAIGRQLPRWKTIYCAGSGPR